MADNIFSSFTAGFRGGRDIQAQRAAGARASAAEQRDIQRFGLEQQKRKQEVERFTKEKNLRSIANDFLELEAIEDPEERNEFLRTRAKRVAQENGDNKDTMELLRMSPEEQEATIPKLRTLLERKGVIDRLPQQKFTKPFQAVDAQGQPIFAERGAEGALREIPGGIRPPVKAGAGAPNARASGIKAFAPVLIENKETGETRLVSPVVNPTTGAAEALGVDFPPGFTVAKDSPEQQARRKVRTARLTAGSVALGKERSAIAEDIRDAARQANKTIPTLRRVMDGLNKIETGKLAQAKRLLGPFIHGIDPTNEQALNAELNLLVFDELAKFVGAISDPEREFAMETTANMSNSTEANRIIIKRLITRLSDAVEEGKQFRAFDGDAENFVFKPPASRMADIQQRAESFPGSADMSLEELIQLREQIATQGQ